MLHLVMNWRPSLTNSRGISRNSLAWSIAAGMCGVECVECGVRACIRQFRFAGVAFGGSWYGEFGLWLCGVGRTLRRKWDWSHLEDSWSSSCQIWGRRATIQGLADVPCPLPPFREGRLVSNGVRKGMDCCVWVCGVAVEYRDWHVNGIQ